ncbi:unnamed protein product [Coccothraustes coccothraustes]
MVSKAQTNPTTNASRDRIIDGQSQDQHNGQPKTKTNPTVNSRPRPPQWSAHLTVNQVKTNPTVISINAQPRSRPSHAKSRSTKQPKSWSAKTSPTRPQCPPKSRPTNGQPDAANGQLNPWSTRDRSSQWSAHGQGQARVNLRPSQAMVKPRLTNGQAKANQWSSQK